MKRTSDKSSALTPLMRQYYAVKEKHPDKILFFRMGDFYEMFGDDAVKAAPILGIALTSRCNYMVHYICTCSGSLLDTISVGSG